MTLFTLIYGDKVEKAPGTKVVPADDFSTLLSAKELVEKIKTEAEQYRCEVAAEAEGLKEIAQREGFAAGLAIFSEHIALLEKEIGRVEEELSKKVLSISLQAAKKIVGREMELNEATIGDIVINSLRAVAEHKRITIYCHKDDRDRLETRKEEMKPFFERLESLVIQERDDVEQGGCIIETEAGIINAQWDPQWDALEAAFKKILGS